MAGLARSPGVRRLLRRTLGWGGPSRAFCVIC